MPKHQPFIDYFTHEFMEELWYLQKVARGDITKRAEVDPWENFFNVTQGLLSLAPIPGLPLGFLLSKELVKQCIKYSEKGLKLAQQANSAAQAGYKKWKKTLEQVDSAQQKYEAIAGKPESKGMLQQEGDGPMDLTAIRVLVELVGRGLAERYEHVLSDYLDGPPQKSQVPLARVMVRRLFHYLQDQPFLNEALSDGLLAQRTGLLNGMLYGKLDEDKSWREKLTSKGSGILPRVIKDMYKVELPLQAVPKEQLKKQSGIGNKFTSEGVIKRSAWYDDKQIYARPKTEWWGEKGKLAQPKYGYAYIADSRVLPKDSKELSASSSYTTPPRANRYYQPVSVADIQAYLATPEIKTARAAKQTTFFSFHTFLQQKGCPQDLQAVCHDDLTAIKDWSFANFSGVDFSGAQITGNISGADFSGSYLIGITATAIQCQQDHPVNLSRVQLGFADLRCAQLPQANFTQAELQLTNLSGADLTAIHSEGTNWYKTDLTGVTRQDLLAEQAKQVAEAQQQFKARMQALDDRLMQTELELVALQARIETLEKQQLPGENNVEILQKIEALQAQMKEKVNSDFQAICEAELRKDITGLRTDVDQLKVQIQNVGQLEKQLDQLKRHFADQITSTLAKAGDVGRKILAEQTTVQLSHHIKDLEFYLPPTVIERLPEKLTLDELIEQLNTLPSATLLQSTPVTTTTNNFSSSSNNVKHESEAVSKQESSIKDQADRGKPEQIILVEKKHTSPASVVSLPLPIEAGVSSSSSSSSDAKNEYKKSKGFKDIEATDDSEVDEEEDELVSDDEADEEEDEEEDECASDDNETDEEEAISDNKATNKTGSMKNGVSKIDFKQQDLKEKRCLLVSRCTLLQQQTKVHHAEAEKELESLNQAIHWIDFQLKALEDSSAEVSSSAADIKPFSKMGSAPHTPKTYMELSVPGDGDCLYSAVALYVGQDQQQLRDQVADELERKPEEYKPFLELKPGQTAKDYIAGVRRRHGELAGQVEIRALMNILRRPIIVVRPGQNAQERLQNLDKLLGEDLYFGSGIPIPVKYNGHNHYDAIVVVEKQSYPLESSQNHKTHSTGINKTAENAGKLSSPSTPAIPLPQYSDTITVIDQFLQQEENLLLLLGESGAGKSLSTWQTAHRLLAQFQPQMTEQQISQCWLPIYIELNQFTLSDLGGLVDRQLKAYGLSEAAIGKLKRTSLEQTAEPKVLLLLDGYDELQQEVQSDRRKHANFFKRIGGESWPQGRLKVLVTCRRRYLTDLSEERMIFGTGKHQRYQRYELLPFTMAQVGSYITACTKVDLGGDLLKPEDYFKAIAATDSLKNLVSSPFVLWLFLRSLPRLVRAGRNIQHITRFDLYHEFFGQWTEREVWRLNPAKRATLGRDKDVTLINDFKRLAYYLALSMYANGRTTVVFTGLAQTTSEYNVWYTVLKKVAEETELEHQALETQSGESEDDIFGLTSAKPKLDKTTVMRQAQARTNQLVDMLPLRHKGNSYEFMHRSIYEYLIAASIINLANSDPTFEATILNFFKQRLIQNEPAVVNFFGELATQSKITEQQTIYSPLRSKLFEIIKRSAKESALSQASSNAATILNACHEPLGYQSWAGVQLAGADLRYCVLAHSNLTGANLRGASLAHSVLYHTNLSDADLRDVKWDERPRLQLKQIVFAITHHPKEPWLAITQENEIVLMHRDTGEQIGQTMVGHKEWVLSLAFSPDGSRLASGSRDKTIRLWEVSNQTLLGVISGHKNEVSSVAFSPDGLRLISDDHSVRLWEVAALKQLSAPDKPKGAYCIAVSRDGSRLAFGSVYGTVSLRDMASQKPLGDPMRGHKNSVTGVLFSPNGSYLASKSFDSICLWDVNNQTLLGTLREHAGSWRGMAFSHDSTRLAAYTENDSVYLWDVESQKLLGVMTGHTGVVRSVAFSNDDSLLISGSYDHTVRVWNVSSQMPLGIPMDGHTDQVTSVAFSHNGVLASGGKDKTIRLWRANSQACLRVLTGHRGEVESVAFSRDGVLASGGKDCSVRLWKVSSKTSVCAVIGFHKDEVTSVAFNSDGTCLASGSYDKTVRLWNMTTQKPLGSPMRGRTGVTSVAFSPNGVYLAAGCEGKAVRLWQVGNQQALGVMRRHQDRVVSVAFSPNGAHVASGSWDYTIQLWDVTRRTPLGGALLGHTGFVDSVAFNPDGMYLASGGYDHKMQLWVLSADGAETNCVAALHWQQPIKSIAFAPSSNGQNAISKLKETKSSVVSTGLPVRPDQVTEDEDLLAIGDKAGTISFWAVARRNASLRFIGMPKHSGMPLLFQGAQLSGCKMSPMSKRLLEQHGGEVSGVIVVKDSVKSFTKTKPHGAQEFFRSLLAASQAQAKKNQEAQRFFRNLLAASQAKKNQEAQRFFKRLLRQAKAQKALVAYSKVDLLASQSNQTITPTNVTSNQNTPVLEQNPLPFNGHKAETKKEMIPTLFFPFQPAPPILSGGSSFFANSAASPVEKSDAKIQSLLAELYALVDKVYPENNPAVAQQRYGCLDKLQPYQDHQAVSAVADLEELRNLQTELEKAQEAQEVLTIEH